MSIRRDAARAGRAFACQSACLRRRDGGRV